MPEIIPYQAEQAFLNPDNDPRLDDVEERIERAEIIGEMKLDRERNGD